MTERPRPKKTSAEEEEIRNNLKLYYEKYFDVKLLLKLFKDHPFETREFGFIRRDDGRMHRNKSFQDPDYLVEYLSFFPTNHAYLGAIYEDPVKPRINYVPGISIDQTKWLGRELTFDLDLTDYDTIRIDLCGCQGRKFCEICWKLMQYAADVIQETMEEDFGFTEMVWFFSGGRGYHCWVLDDMAFTLDEDQRKAIVGYLQLIHSSANAEKIEELGKGSGQLKGRIYSKLIRPYILETDIKELSELDGFAKTTIEKAKNIIAGDAIPAKIIQAIPKQVRPALEEKVIKHRFPRLDSAVTEGHNHLIRVPNGVHGGSGYITQEVADPTKFNPIADARHFYELLSLDPADYKSSGK